MGDTSCLESERVEQYDAQALGLFSALGLRMPHAGQQISITREEQRQ
jgi:hypothetical protein